MVSFQVYLRAVDNGKKHGQKISRSKHDVSILRQLFNGSPSQQDEMSGLITVLHYMGGENLGRMDECENVNDRSPKDNHLKWRTHGIKIFTNHVYFFSFASKPKPAY